MRNEASKLNFFLLLGALSFAVSGLAAHGIADQCKGHPSVIAACYTVKGDIGWSNGSYTAKIMTENPPRFLGITNDLQGIRWPKRVIQLLGGGWIGGNWDVSVYGRFTVCPVNYPTSEGIDSVCLESGKHLQVRGPEHRPDPPYFRRNIR